MTFDPVGEAVTLFGGQAELGGSDETWEWNGGGIGNAWMQLQAFGPSARSSHAMAYDEARGVTVLYGGERGSSVLADTWEWDGLSWIQMPVTGPGTPGSRAGHAMSYDSARGVVVLFGGLGDQGMMGDTWEWDGAEWTLRAITGPSPRRYHAMAFDEARGVTVLHGGIQPPVAADTWEWDGTTWTHKAGTPGLERYEAGLTYDAVHHGVVLFGGAGSLTSVHADAWRWDGATWTQIANGGPARHAHAQTFDSARRVHLIFGGDDGSAGPSRLGDTWELRCPCNADCDQSTGYGVFDIFDYLCFQDRFFRGDPYACDCDTTTGAGACDVFDFLCFQDAFVRGCP
jgi:hypothetical protein